MRFLLPMAYALLSIIEDGVRVNGNSANGNINYSYRLMEIEEPKTGRPKLPSSSKDYHNIQSVQSSYITPRLKQRNNYGNEPSHSSIDQIQNANFENIIKPTTKRSKFSLSEIPEDFEREISSFHIPPYLPNRTPLKKKRKIPPSPTAAVAASFAHHTRKKKRPVNDDDVDINYPDNDTQEEEEVEEKKEKVVKTIIKKKKPFSNATQTTVNEYRMTERTSPYRTIVDMNRGAGTTIPYRIHKPNIRPLHMKENVDVLDPTYYYEYNKNIRKGIKPRDVNLILKTRHNNPRILIRRYRPYYTSTGQISFFPSGSHKPSSHLEQQQQKPCRKCRKRRKKYRRKKFNAAAENVPPCNNAPLPYITNAYPIYGHQQKEFGDFPYQYSQSQNSPNRYTVTRFHPQKLVTPDDNDNVNEYIETSYENHHHNPAESFSSTFTSTELPYSEKNEYLPGYDVHEQENLDIDHQREPDEDLEEETEIPLYDEGETDNIQEYDGNEEESNQRWDLSPLSFQSTKQKHNRI